MPSSRFRFLINPAIAAAMAAIFVIDLNTPFGLAIPFLYLLLALAAIAVGARTRALVVIAILGPLLAGIKIEIHPSDGIVWAGESNRLMFSMLIWIVVGRECFRRKLEAERRANSRELERQVCERTEALHAAKQKLEIEIAERKEAEAIISDYTARLEALSKQLVAVQDAERKALASELHDRIGQNLSALNMSLNLNLALLSGQPTAAALSAAQARISDALALVEQTTEMVRSVMEELHPALLEQYGLNTALRWHGEEFSGRTGIVFRYTPCENLPRLPATVETALFRIVQEALINVAKHAQATEVAVTLTRNGDCTVLQVDDNGVGMAQARQRPPAAGSGWGLAIMAERARTIGATLQTGPGRNRGTRLAVTLPNHHQETA